MHDNKKSNANAGLEWLVVFLFFCGVALIAAGLWHFSSALALVFLGIACLYVAGCVSMAAKSPERTDRK